MRSYSGAEVLLLNLICSYLQNQTQKVKVKKSYSDRSNINNGVPQGSVLGSLLFNIDLTDFLFEFDDSRMIQLHIILQRVYQIQLYNCHQLQVNYFFNLPLTK